MSKKLFLLKVFEGIRFKNLSRQQKRSKNTKTNRKARKRYARRISAYLELGFIIPAKVSDIMAYYKKAKDKSDYEEYIRGEL